MNLHSKSFTSKIVTIIPARGGSKGIHMKNIVPLCGHPLIAWSIRQAKCSMLAQDVFVSTDDDRIARISQRYGAKVIGRPKELALDTSRTEETLFHSINSIEETGDKIDVVVLLQATSPVREPSDIDGAVLHLFSEKADSLFSGRHVEGFAWHSRPGGLVPLNYDLTKRPMRQGLVGETIEENGSIYVFRPNILRDYNSRLGGKIACYKMPYWKSFQIDKPEDIRICKHYIEFAKLHIDDHFPETIDLIVFDFDGVFTDNKVLTTEDGKEIVACNRSDGIGINMIRKSNIPMFVLSTETNPVVASRMKKLGLPFVQGVVDKLKYLTEFVRKEKYDLNNIIYVGNDVNDIEAMKIVGYPIAPGDAHEEVKVIAKLILDSSGGDGVVRELAEILSQ